MVNLIRAKEEVGRIRTVVADFFEQNLEKKFKKLNVPTLTDLDRVVKQATAKCDKEITSIKKKYEKELGSIKGVIGEILDVKNKVWSRLENVPGLQKTKEAISHSFSPAKKSTVSAAKPVKTPKKVVSNKKAASKKKA